MITNEQRINLTAQNIKNDLHKMEQAKLFKASSLEAKLQQFLHNTINFNLSLKLRSNEYNREFTQKTGKVILKIIYKYLKEKKVKNLIKIKNGIKYNYLYSIITCIIVSNDGIVTFFLYRELQ